MVELKIRTARWYEVTTIAERVQDDGSGKKVKEVYVADALSCTEAEARIVDEIADVAALEVIKVQLLPISEFVFDSDAETWYKFKVAFITMDEVSGKEKRNAQYFMVQAKDDATARESLCQLLGKGMLDYEITACSKTAVLEVFEHNAE